MHAKLILPARDLQSLKTEMQTFFPMITLRTHFPAKQLHQKLNPMVSFRNDSKTHKKGWKWLQAERRHWIISHVLVVTFVGEHLIVCLHSPPLPSQTHIFSQQLVDRSCLLESVIFRKMKPDLLTNPLRPSLLPTSSVSTSRPLYKARKLHLRLEWQAMFSRRAHQ